MFKKKIVVNASGIIKKININKTKKPVKEDIVALEISNDRVFISQLSGSINDWKLSKFDYTHFENNINLDDENSRKYASRVISGLLKRSDIKTKSVAFTLVSKSRTQSSLGLYISYT